MSSLRRRALLAAAGVLGLSLSVAAAPSSSAHTCTQIRVYVNGNLTPIGSCHAPGDPGPADVCTGLNLAPTGTGAGYTVCVHMPVAAI